MRFNRLPLAAMALVLALSACKPEWLESRDARETPRAPKAQFVATPAPTSPPAPSPTRRVETATRVPASPTRPAPTATAKKDATCPAITVTIGQTQFKMPAVPVENEIEIGEDSAEAIERKTPVSRNASVTARVQRIGKTIAPKSDRPTLTYTFKVLEVDDINAFALPGGFIYVYRGMVDFVKSDDELAAVVGHEIAHVAKCHGAEQIQYDAAQTLAVRQLKQADPTVFRNERARLSAQMQSKVQEAGWTREQELEADEHGTIYISRAGYRAQAVIDLLKRLDAVSKEPRNKLERMLSTHPPFTERIATVERAIQQNGLK